MNRKEKETALFQPNNFKIFKVIIIAFILLAVELVVGWFVFTKTKSFAISELQGVYGEAVKSVSAEVKDRFLEGADLEPVFSSELMKDSNNDYSISINGKTYRITNEEKLMSVGAVSIYTLRDICNNQTTDSFILSDKTIYAIYARSEGEAIVLDFKPLDDILGDVNAFGFNGFSIFSESRRVVYARKSDGAMTADEYGDFTEFFSLTIDMPENGVSTPVVPADGSEYIFAINKIEGADYFVGGYVDGTVVQNAIDNLGVYIILFFVVLAILTIAAIVLLAIIPSNSLKSGEYRIVTDSFGKIISSNGRFKEDFPETRVLKERVNAFDESKHYALSIEQAGSEALLCAMARRKDDGAIVLSADKVEIPYGSQIDTEQGKTMKSIYNGFMNQKHLIVGELFFENLNDVLDIFGKDFAEHARNRLIDRINEKFKFVYQIDYHHIGVIQPEGKGYDDVLRDMADYFEYFNKVIKMENNNIIKVIVKGGFAIVDDVMKSRDFDYVFLCADAALRRTEEITDETVRKVNYYIYNESQRKLYEKYFFKIDIPKMLEDGDFYLEYQPQYDVKEGRIVAFEALFRVKQRVQVHASVFQIITYAEQSGFMVQVGEFIFRTGMAFAKSIEGMNVGVSLNVSLVQLMQFGFVDHFMQLYRDHDLKPGSISIELTESFLARKMDETIQKLNILNANGIGIHLDDFGTTYSSFNYLQKLPITAIKVDQSFVREIYKNDYNRLISGVIIKLARDLGLRSICEGVETHEQLKTLKTLGVDIIQGYLISRSVDEDVAREMIKTFRYNDPDEVKDVSANDTAVEGVDEGVYGAEVEKFVDEIETNEVADGATAPEAEKTENTETAEKAVENPDTSDKAEPSEGDPVRAEANEAPAADNTAAETEVQPSEPEKKPKKRTRTAKS